MKFLVTGSTGLVGTQVVKDLSINHKVFSCYHHQKPQHGNPIHLDLTDLSSIETAMEQVKPDVVIHLAAMTDVDGCEDKKDLAFLINAKATEKLAKQAALQNAFLVHISTDYVFDGTKKCGVKMTNQILWEFMENQSLKVKKQLKTLHLTGASPELVLHSDYI